MLLSSGANSSRSDEFLAVQVLLGASEDFFYVYILSEHDNVYIESFELYYYTHLRNCGDMILPIGLNFSANNSVIFKCDEVGLFQNWLRVTVWNCFYYDCRFQTILSTTIATETYLVMHLKLDLGYRSSYCYCRLTT